MTSEVLACYESIAAKSGVMLEAARSSDWDGLVAAERECAALVARLRAIGPPPELSAGERARQRALVHAVLANDAEIRRLTQPWVEQVERLLAGTAMLRRAQQSYAA
jgi:flagellar protein FliT